MSASVTHLNTPRAGFDPRNTAFLDQLLQFSEALLTLTGMGHKVLCMHAQIGVLPSIQLEPSPALTELAATDRATFYHYGTDPQGRRFRHGQFQISGVRCIWVEYVDH